MLSVFSNVRAAVTPPSIWDAVLELIVPVFMRSLSFIVRRTRTWMAVEVEMPLLGSGAVLIETSAPYQNS
jgi:hypothetical protein